ncbi:MULTISPECIES: phage tail tape measure protein [Cryobacterium]|uniref:Phage tail tape measure protein n=1 Tax=Cryobacterium breve TaxID=1259258 RepID=A0ABY2J833_9MICO|nr:MULTISPECIES: phage tail tape measure protein [Cryobacterium]TFC92038.1 phage tail tape measure protein [Cryobacterium sp. TmT3-12]TFC99823.1 phage tail tape measure protein [Cryobacterium breve]
MFEAGALGFRIQMIGSEVFKKDARSADDAVKALGESAERTAKKVAPTGEALDKTGKAAKDAKAPVEDAGKATKKLGDEADTAAPKVKKTSESVEDLKRKSDDAAQTIGVAAVGIGAAVVAMAGISVKKYAEFGQAMSQVGAASMASAEDQKALGESALEAGASSVFSATEAANAQVELAKAGLATSDILGGALVGSLALAAAGQLGVARAAEIAATTLTVFKLKGDQAGHVADLLAAGAGKAQGSVDDLALGLDYVGVTFARLNIPLEDTVGTLALLASNGLLGEKAGTGLRSVISSLTAPVAKGAEVMKQYGINVFDAQGKFIGMAGVAEELKTGLGGLDEQTRSAALGAIFGAEAASAAGILYASGAKGVEEWTENVDDQGYAAEQARIATDNLTGDIERLGGSMDTALIKTGSLANEALREMVQILSGLVDWYGNLDEGVQGTVLWLGIGTGAALLLGGTFLLAVPKIVAFRAALTTLNTTMKGTAIAGGVIGLALTAILLVLAAVGGANADAAAKTQAYGDTLDTVSKKITSSTRDMAKANLAAEESFLWLKSDSTYDAAEKLGIGLDLVTDAATGNVGALKSLQEELDVGEIGSKRYKKAIENSGLSASDFALALIQVRDGVTGENESIEEAIRLAEQKQGVDGETIDGNAGVGESYDAVTESVDAVITSVVDLAAELDELNGKNLDAREAARQLESAYDDFDAALKENGPSLNEFGTDLDLTTEKGRENQAALDAIAAAASAAGQAVVDSGGSYGDYRASLEASKAQIDQRIADLGITGEAAQDLSDKILHIPTKAEFTAYADTQAATEKAAAYKRLLDSIPRNVATSYAIDSGTIGGIPRQTFNQADGGVVSYFANGGEHHVAQIAKAGAMRVWAEPETGGEAYIPLAGAKRGRSTAILADVADQFGYQLVPVGAQSFADGGRRGGRQAPTSGASVIQHITTPPNEDPRILAAQIAREFKKAVAG